MAAGAVAVAAVLAGGLVYTTVGRASASGGFTITVTDKACAPQWRATTSGHPTFDVSNVTSEPYEVDLLGADQRSVYGRIEMLGPHTHRTLQVALPPGEYSWSCDALSGVVSFSKPAPVRGAAVTANPYIPASYDEIAAAVLDYRTRIAGEMKVLAKEVDRLRVAVTSGQLGPARVEWLTAHMQYERLGAAYGTFGDFDAAIDGRADGLAGGVHDPKFTGFLRLEYGLWHDETMKQLTPIAARLAADVHTLVKQFPTLQTAPNDIALRTHEILENSLQFELTGSTDEGSHTNLATVRANIDGTEATLAAIAPLLQTRAPALLAQARTGLTHLATMLDAYDRHGSWRALANLTRAQRETLAGTVSGLLELLDPIPDILAVDRDSD